VCHAQSSRHLLSWSEHQKVGSLQELGIHNSTSDALGVGVGVPTAETLEPSGELPLNSHITHSTDGLVMTNELQNLLADMDWG
jgi:hypothetical protein